MVGRSAATKTTHGECSTVEGLQQCRRHTDCTRLTPLNAERFPSLSSMLVNLDRTVAGLVRAEAY
jgi:hypothetical protein